MAAQPGAFDDPSQFRERVVHFYGIIMEHSMADRAPEFVAALIGPSAELLAAYSCAMAEAEAWLDS
jgi:hypothetical protein